jgi:bifunctional DNase/RNase
MPDKSAPIAFELHKIMIAETRTDQIVTLREVGGIREFPIVIGIFEAIAIDRRLREEVVPRPLTHDLLSNVIERFGGELLNIVVTDYIEGTYFAKLDILSREEHLFIDCRPSDAIALAIRAGAAIFVEPVVLEKVGKENS